MQQVMRDLITGLAAAVLTAPAAVHAADAAAQPRPATVGAALPPPSDVRPAVDAMRAAPPTLRGNLDPLRGPIATSVPASPRDIVTAPDGAPYHTWTGYSPN
jgi:hypothetical protein